MNLQITGLRVDAGGEGSRGGKVIGHTTSGKPIYATFKHPAQAPAHEITSKHHLKAAEYHKAEAQKSEEKASAFLRQDPRSAKHFSDQSWHKNQERQHSAVAVKKGRQEEVEKATALQKSQDMKIVQRGGKTKGVAESIGLGKAE